MTIFRKYHIDPYTLQAVKAPLSFVRPLIIGVAFVAGWFLIDIFFTSPQELLLMSDNKAMHEQFADSRHQYSELVKRVDDLSETDRELYRLILQAEPLSKDLRRVGIGGVDTYSRFEGFSSTTEQLLRENAAVVDQLERKIRLQNASYEYLRTLGSKNADYLAQLPAIRPTKGGRLVSKFDSETGVKRMHPILNYRRRHAGVDIAVPVNTPVYATGAGVVEQIGYANLGYGRYIVLNHQAAGYKTLYAHLNSIAQGIEVGDSVARGVNIAMSGNTGLSVGPHIHYEVRDQNNKPLNPIRFFAASMSSHEYQQLLDQVGEFENLPPLD